MKEFIKNKNLKTIKNGWQGNLIVDGIFRNGSVKESPTSLFDILKWRFSKNPYAEQKKTDIFHLNVINNESFIHSENDMIVWLGHATFFIRLNGITMITDPIFNNIMMIKRLVGLPLAPSKLTSIDYILLSHGHRDHFDKKSIQTLHQNNPNIKALIPLKNGDFFNKIGLPFQEAGWYQQFKVGNVSIYFLPAHHWNRRGMRDFNLTLWGSFIIQNDKTTIYFAGDTAYGNHFKDIAEMFPKIDYCLMPIGAYKPEYIMKESHLSPTEALQAFKDLKGKVFIPMHFATFDLADEPIGEPVEILKKEKGNSNVKFLDIGQELYFD